MPSYIHRRTLRPYDFSCASAAVIHAGLSIGKGILKLGRQWLFQMFVIVAITSILGAFSILVSTIVKRPLRGFFILGGFFCSSIHWTNCTAASVIDNQYEIILDE